MHTLIIALGFAFIICFIVTIVIVISIVVFSVQFKKLIAKYGSIILPAYSGYAFGMNKIDRQNTYRRYFLSGDYKKEAQPKVRHLGEVGRRLYIVFFANIFLAFLVLICFVILNILGITK